MRRVATAVVILAALALGAAGLAATTSTKAPEKAGQAKVTNLTVWVGWSARELGVFKSIVAEYDQKHPEVSIKVVGGINDDKIVAGIRSGKVPDVVSSFTSANVGNYCSSGGWIDLGPLMAQDHVNANVFPKTSQYYTQYNGKRCALPLLADTYGLYYNKKLLKAAGLKGPPKTISQLTAYAKKLTKKNPDGSIKVAGYDPFLGFYAGNAPDLSTYGPLFGAKWVDSKLKSTMSSSPGWAKALRWQKSLVDWYGYNNLVKFQAGAADEFSASNAFEVGKLAMAQDGEWRVAFIAAEHPELDYGTAPMPVDDAHPELYGSGYVNGTIIGIPKGVKHKTEAWALLKYLTFDTHALAKLSNGLRNVPTTTASLKSGELTPDPKFKVFLDIFAHPKTATTPITAAGSANQELFQDYVAKWQAGKVSDLQSGLANVDKQIDAQLANSAGTQVP
jgi:multiple sugar transport system substrate-binding protein